MDKKTVAGAAAVALGVAGLGAVAYSLLKNDAAADAVTRAKPASEPAPSAGRVDLNRAAASDLMTLRHIGRGRAKRIISSRPFRSPDDLLSRGILPEPVFLEVRDRLAV